jgi:hypothetical protein
MSTIFLFFTVDFVVCADYGVLDLSRSLPCGWSANVVSAYVSNVLGNTLFLRSQRVALNARFLPPSLLVDFSMAFGLMCCRLLTGLERASYSSSSSASCGASSVRDLRLNLRQIFFSFPSPTLFTSFFLSHPRGILVTGRALGSRNAASVSFQVLLNVVVGVARLRGVKTMTSAL